LQPMMAPEQIAPASGAPSWGIPETADEAAATGPRFLPAPAAEPSNTRHEVMLDLSGLPAGARVNTTKAEGPATLELRVQRAMSSPW
jgi:hypothetical protein